MSLPYNRVYNFAPGPACLPLEVLEQARDDLVNYKGVGLSVMEMSHRSKEFETIIREAEEDLRKLLGLPESTHVLFLQGGATLQFSMVPMAFMSEGRTADYVITGTWGKKAFEAAQLVGQPTKIYDGKDSNYDHAPCLSDLKLTEGAAYVHITSNETIQGVDYLADTRLPVPVVCDMSSNILSRPIDPDAYDLIYAGAQKNMGPAGVTVVIVKDEFLQKAPAKTHPMLDYRLHAENKSLYNTPPCWAIYICGLVYKHLLAHGGLAAQAERNQAKAKLIYDAIDESGGVFRGHAQKANRSLMNITFTLANDEITERFLKEAKENGFAGLKGHRSVGGCRASIYNAFPHEGCVALAQFMRDFACRNG